MPETPSAATMVRFGLWMWRLADRFMAWCERKAGVV